MENDQNLNLYNSKTNKGIPIWINQLNNISANEYYLNMNCNLRNGYSIQQFCIE